MSGERSLDVIAIIEACYRLELDEAAWLQGVVEAARPFLGRGASAYLYDASSGTRVDVKTSFVPDFIDFPAFMRLLSSVPPEYIRDAWMSRRVGYASEIQGFNETLKERLRAIDGATNVLAVNGLDPTAQGFWLGAPLWGRVTRSARKVALLDRVSTHLAAAFRMRRTLALPRQAGPAPASTDAVLATDGTLEHAEGEAREKEARSELRLAVMRVERARSRAGRSDPEKAVGLWRGLVSARWTLLDQFHSNGVRYVVARKNPVAGASISTLSKREIEVLSWAMLGHDNKVIAYELGISSSTVRVLMHRAAAKLKAPNRRALLEKFAALNQKPPTA